MARQAIAAFLRFAIFILQEVALLINGLVCFSSLNSVAEY